MDEVDLKFVPEEKFPEVARKVRKYLSQTKDPDSKLVGERLLNELKHKEKYPGMFIISAEEKGEIMGVTTGAITPEYGLSYHTMILSDKDKGKGFGSQLYTTKKEYLLDQVGNMVAKPESESGKRITEKSGFKKAPELNDLLYWEGTSYLLKKDYSK